MPKALILVADGSEEIETVAPYDVLVRAGFHVQSVGVDLESGGLATMSRGICIVPEISSLHELPYQTAHEIFDILILPGGAKGAQTFCSSDEVLQMITNFRGADKYVAAICAATTAVVAAASKFGGDKVEVTSHPSVKDQIVRDGWEYSEERFQLSGKVLTSRGPGTAIGFGLKIVEMFYGEAKAKEVAGPMILADVW